MLKRATLTVSYYVIALTILFLLGEAYPSGPCTPGPAIFLFPVMITLSAGLLIRNIYVTTRVGKDNLPATVVHSVACLFMLTAFL